MLKYKINPRFHKVVGPDGLSTININVPLDVNFGLDLNQELLSNEMFFDKIKADVLPKIIDKEKIVIYPAVYSVDPDSGEPILSLADEIEINLHFRRRWDCVNKNRIITDGWLTNDTYEWTTGQTGCECENPENPSTQIHDYNWEEFDPTNYDERSDLVGYLGFDDDDIFYQKSKVKKSFLRLMYFDSKALLNKNLLAYSTSFLDSGKLFTKYSLIRNNETLFKYVQESERYDNEMALFEPGRQPVLSGPPKPEQEEELKENEKYDYLRMSSTITLKDKYNDDASSDGFYIYLFKEDAPSERPIDLYLKAEFNNAKYGKTINLMLPIGDDGVPIRFGDTGTTEGETVVGGFPRHFIIESGSGDNVKTNFNFQAYYDSMYINVKCKYDKTLKKYVYYFPWDPEIQRSKMEEGKEYTVSNDTVARKITLNFFEPKINKAYNVNYNING